MAVARRVLQLTVFFILLLNILSAVFILYETQQELELVTARAGTSNTGNITLCINFPPSLGVPCNTTMAQDQPYFCQLNGTDVGPSNLSYFQIPQPPDNVSIFYLSPTGLINFTPLNNDTGNHSTILGVDDNSGCENAYAYYMFNYEIKNVNDPPYLIRAIPNQMMMSGTTLYAFRLDDYFNDPDGDPLTYEIIRSATGITINATLHPDSTVSFRSDECGRGHFQFVATDPFNLSANSNAVQVEVVCEVAGGGVDDGSGGSGGGGGGGGAFCIPEMVCMPWSDCYPNGLMVQVCYDKNGCNNDEVKFYKECDYGAEPPLCEENWLCSEWGPCFSNGLQNRTCIDLTECGTENSMPPLEQSCVYIPTCFDGIQNGGETGIDCGGPCESCREVQQPTILESGKFPTLLVLLAILLLSILLALFVLYREKIYEGLAALGWMMARRHDKELLLAPSEKQVLFEALRKLGKDLRILVPIKAYQRLAEIIRTYYSFILDIPFETTREELSALLVKRELSEELRRVLSSFLQRLDLLESGRLPVDRLRPVLFSSTFEELRLLVCMTSAYELTEVAREVPERHITQEMSFVHEIRLRLMASYEALQFLRTDVVQEQYMAILRAYDALDVGKRELLYGDIDRLYQELLYLRETTD
ncbi:hypothetical protein GOV07_01270 [Candidatus Woesearchaeota archaeon]|nr:hypothetical protein [Candidatus Woesearchaeota archaeon]